MVTGGWFTCPVCHRRLIRIDRRSTMYRVPVYCRTCKSEWFPAIFNGRELEAGKIFPLTGEKVS